MKYCSDGSPAGGVELGAGGGQLNGPKYTVLLTSTQVAIKGTAQYSAKAQWRMTVLFGWLTGGWGELVGGGQ